LLAWWIAPVTLFVFWGRFLARHDWLGTGLHIALLVLAIGLGWMSYRLARATLRGAPRKPFVWAQAFKDVRTYKRVTGMLVTCAIGAIFYYVSVGAIEGDPNYAGYVKSGNIRRHSFRVLVPRILENIGLRPFANLVEEDVSIKSPNWTGRSNQYYPLVKGAHLGKANMQWADADFAFLANADLRNANLNNARLRRADLSGAKLENSNLSEANLSEAKLFTANIQFANLQHACLRNADLTEANLTLANLRGAYLRGADLSRAILGDANLEEADLRGANLSDAKFSAANLGGALLEHTQLRGVDLRPVKGLTRSQIVQATIDEKTLLPADIPP
jgi:uncharacterized protein YjbI with pentapeptide repeats